MDKLLLLHKSKQRGSCLNSYYRHQYNQTNPWDTYNQNPAGAWARLVCWATTSLLHDPSMSHHDSLSTAQERKSTAVWVFNARRHRYGCVCVCIYGLEQDRTLVATQRMHFQLIQFGSRIGMGIGPGQKLLWVGFCCCRFYRCWYIWQCIWVRLLT